MRYTFDEEGEAGEELRKGLGQENLDTLKQFIENQEWIYGEGNLRAIIRVLSYAPKLPMPDETTKQYHIAMIHKLDTIDEEAGSRGWGIRAWGEIKSQREEKYDPAEYILGAIATMPDKALVRDLIEFSYQSGKIAHPIFDSNGFVRWPREMSSEEMKKLVTEREEEKKEKNDLNKKV